MQVNWWWLSLSCVGLLPTHGLPGSSVHEIFPGKKTGVIAISFSRGSSRPKDHTRVSCIAGGTLPLSHHTGQFSSAAQLCPTLCDSMDCSTPGFPLHHQLLELGQTHFRWIGDATQPSHPLSSLFTFNLSQHQGLFQWVSFSHQVAKVLGFQL